jgi:Fe-S-cluster containining protein
MASQPAAAPKEITANVELGLPGGTLRCRLTVPFGMTSPVALLPVFRALAENIVSVAVSEQEAEGKKITCKKGCGACCRQLVPVSASEARRIRDYLEEMPEPRRSELKGRFAAAREALREAEMLPRLACGEGLSREEMFSLGLDYFHLGIPCPFLEEESCSIYDERPISCRQYLVTSPAKNCAEPTRGKVAVVPLPGIVSSALMHSELSRGSSTDRWLTLTLAPEWADAHPDLPRSRPGPELLRDVFEALTGDRPPPVAQTQTMNTEEAG